MNNIWFAAFCLLVSGLLVLPILYGRRREIRQFRKGGGVHGLGLAITVCVVLCCLATAVVTTRLLGYRLYHWFVITALLVGVLALWLHQIRIRREARRRRETCPVCLERKLELVRRGHIEEVYCPEDLPWDPPDPCAFRTSLDCQRLPRICIAGIGTTPAAGVTTWRAMLYREMLAGHYPQDVSLRVVDSSELENVQHQLDDLVKARSQLAATLAPKMPHPLSARVHDRSRLGPLEAVAHVFDFAGEIGRMSMVGDIFGAVQRRRMLMADAHMIFLDAGWDLPDERPKRSDRQMKTLAGIIDDLQTMCGKRPFSRDSRTMALCVSKIDSFVLREYARMIGADKVDHFYSQLEEIDRRCGPFTITGVEARSRLIADLLPSIWPNSDIEAQVRRYFGNRVMFFPVSPYGLFEPDAIDNAKGSIYTVDWRKELKPYGVLEPVLWLLEMNGYRMLD